MASQAQHIRREYRFSGQVQGVGFRYTVRRLAAGHRVSGFVRNLPNGQVQLVVEGASPQIKMLYDQIVHQMADYVDRTESHDGPATGEFDGFTIRY